jgi:hypothetical protein
LYPRKKVRFKTKNPIISDRVFCLEVGGAGGI